MHSQNNYGCDLCDVFGPRICCAQLLGAPISTCPLPTNLNLAVCVHLHCCCCRTLNIGCTLTGESRQAPALPSQSQPDICQACAAHAVLPSLALQHACPGLPLAFRTALLTYIWTTTACIDAWHALAATPNPNSHVLDTPDGMLRLTHHRYRTQLCRDGAACQRRVCFFAHDPRDLRPPTTVLGPTAQLPLVPGAMPRLIGPAAVSGMGAPGSGVVVVVGRAGGSKGGPAGSPAKRGGPGPAAADLPESAGLFTVSAAPPAAVEPPAVPDGPAATTTSSSSSSSPRGGTSAAGAAAVGEQVAALQLGSSSPSKAAGQNGEGGMLAADAPAAGPVQGDPGESSEADGAAGADGAVSSPMAAAAAPSGAEGAAVPSVGSPAAAAPAAPGGGQQTRVAVEVLDASGKPVFIHPDNVKLLDVLLREVPPEEGRRNLPRPSGAPLLRFTPPAMPEAMAAGNRGHNPASRYPGPAGTMPVADSRPGNRRGNPQGGGPFPLGGYGRGPHAGRMQAIRRGPTVVRCRRAAWVACPWALAWGMVGEVVVVLPTRLGAWRMGRSSNLNTRCCWRMVPPPCTTTSSSSLQAWQRLCCSPTGHHSSSSSWGVMAVPWTVMVLHQQ
jgi:hypothetical protein